MQGRKVGKNWELCFKAQESWKAFPFEGLEVTFAFNFTQKVQILHNWLMNAHEL